MYLVHSLNVSFGICGANRSRINMIGCIELLVKSVVDDLNFSVLLDREEIAGNLVERLHDLLPLRLREGDLALDRLGDFEPKALE